MEHRIFYNLAIGFFLTLVVMVQSDDTCNLDFEKTLLTIFTPQEQPNVQIRTLRRYMVRLLQNMLAKAEEVEGWNTYVYPKRNLEALARAGYLHTLPEEEEDNQTETRDKKSLATLVKNGQLPIHHYVEDEGNKRSVESLARNGDLRREVQKMLDELYGNLAYTEGFSKRNVASIARDGGFGGKRNAAALLKNDRYLSQMIGQNGDKRNIASLRGNYKPRYKRDIVKRQVDYYGDDVDYPVYQSSDYDNLVDELIDEKQDQKRFLGSIAKTGWYDSPGKRHIGSLARLGWLPAVRNVRRFSRSGRSSNEGCREASADGQTEDYYVPKNSISLDDKRFFSPPTMWKFPLRTFNY